MGSIITRVLTPKDELIGWYPRWFFQEKDDEENTSLRLFLGGTGKTKGKLVTLPLGDTEYEGRDPRSFSEERFKMMFVKNIPYPILVPGDKPGIFQKSGVLLGVMARTSRPSRVEVKGDVKLIAEAYYDSVVCPILEITGDGDVTMFDQNGQFLERLVFTLTNSLINIYKESMK